MLWSMSSSCDGSTPKIGEESATANEERWEALREAGGDRRAAGVVAVDSKITALRETSVEAFVAVGRALVEVHSLVCG